MKQTDKYYNIVSEFAKLFPNEDDFVILKETKNGTRYIEYAFKKGRPHDFTCLSWYLKPHPEYLKEHLVSSKTEQVKSILNNFIV